MYANLQSVAAPERAQALKFRVLKKDLLLSLPRGYNTWCNYLTSHLLITGVVK